MRTTIDLPDNLFRRAKALAALQGISLKDLITSCVEKGVGTGAPEQYVGHKRPLPELIKRTSSPIPVLTNAEIDDILLKEDIEHYGLDRSSGH